MITAGIGVITSRASCSCRWKTPPSIPASPGSRWPPSRELSMICFRSSAVWCSSRSPGLTPKRRTIPFETQLSAIVTGAVRDAEPVQRPRDPARRALGVGDRQHLRHLLADADVQRGDEGEGDRQRERGGDPVREAAEERLDQLRERGLAEEADADRGDRDPDLAGGERFVDLVELLDHGLGPGFAFRGELFDFAAAAAHQRELGGDEEAVDGDQQQQEDEQQDAHQLFGLVLRAGTSSAIRRLEYSWPPRSFFDKCDIEQIMRVATLSEMLEEVVRLGEATGHGSARARAARRTRGPAGDGAGGALRRREPAGDRAGAAGPAAGRPASGSRR